MIDLEVGHVRLAVPADPDAILEDVATIEENRIDDYMPYWSWLWPAALRMATAVHRLPIQPGATVLELGCGTGLVGITARLAGHDVVLSDYRTESVHVARYNARQNGVEGPACVIDWREVPPQRFDVIVACDVLYEQREHASLQSFVGASLQPGGECWIGDPGRQRAAEFVSQAAADFRVALFDETLRELLAPPRSDFFLIRLRPR